MKVQPVTLSPRVTSTSAVKPKTGKPLVGMKREKRLKRYG
jgi:hypothetical protein